MTNQEAFLWIVQTMILANATPASAALEGEENAPSDAAFVAIAEAVRVSSTLPDDLTVPDAAHEFCTYMLPNLTGEDEVPNWLQSLQTHQTGRA